MTLCVYVCMYVCLCTVCEVAHFTSLVYLAFCRLSCLGSTAAAAALVCLLDQPR